MSVSQLSIICQMPSWSRCQIRVLKFRLADIRFVSRDDYDRVPKVKELRRRLCHHL